MPHGRLISLRERGTSQELGAGMVLQIQIGTVIASNPVDYDFVTISLVVER